MVRLLFYLVLGYVIWKVVQIIARSVSTPRQGHGGVFGDRPSQKSAKDFKDVQDAEFEELPPDEKK